MKNPLMKRLPRELIGDIGKYLVIFLFMTATIGFVSGFLVADDSMLAAYNESFEKYNIEDGNFTLSQKASDTQLQHLVDAGVKIYENFFVEEERREPGDVAESEKDDTKESLGKLRIYGPRNEIDLVCLMKGNLPESKDEIAIDRMYADNNRLSIGDEICLGNRTLSICGLVAFSDYSCLFENNSDMMFDAVKFGVGLMTKEGFDAFGTAHLKYRYSFTYDEKPADEQAEKEQSDDFVDVLAKRMGMTLTDYIPRYGSQAINFTGDDMGSDRSMMLVLLYILIAIMAFVFAVTTNNTIAKEACVIGTLRASGYTRRELLSHYLALPVIVTLIAAVIGNVLGYTFFKDICAGMYYGSYSLPTYETRWNVNAFLLTTVVPILLMLLVNVWLIAKRLRLSPLKFLRRDLSGKRTRRAVQLPNFRFFRRFRLRIILQNRSSYLTLFIGITFANVLLLFGMMMSPLLEHYQDDVLANMLGTYQYILSPPEEIDEEDEDTLLGVLQKLMTPSMDTSNPTAEKFCVTTLKSVITGKNSEDIMVYGITDDSAYFNLPEKDSTDSACISEGFAQKYGIRIGDTITVKEPYEDTSYTFTVGSFYHYPAALAVFLPIEAWRSVFEKPDTYFNGYFSETEITDLDEGYIGATITKDDLTKISRQLKVSMGSMFYLINIFSIVLFVLLIYLLIKLIIEKNATSISMVKILGYETREIMSLYLTATTWIVVLSILISFWIATVLIGQIYVLMMAEFSGWLTLYIAPDIYPKMFLMGMAAYLFVALLQLRKIRRIPMDEALKNVE